MKCYFCQSSNPKIIRNKVRFDIPRNVLYCHNCSLIFLEPQSRDLQKYYREEYRGKYGPSVGKGAASKELFDAYYPLQAARLEVIGKYLGKEKRVLDIGCSAGHFLYAIKPFVKECIGIELNEDNAQFVERELGMKVYTKPIEETDLPKEYFDVIFCFHTLEHMDDPLKFLKTVKDYLKNNGLICIMVPNIDEALLSVYKLNEFADQSYREPHLFYFSSKTLGMLMEAAGYKGETSFFQGYNFLNHIHWLDVKGPQKDAKGVLDPILVESKQAPKEIKNELDEWIRKVDKEYKRILVRYNVADILMFVGKKKD